MPLMQRSTTRSELLAARGLHAIPFYPEEHECPAPLVIPALTVGTGIFCPIRCRACGASGPLLVP